MKRGQMQGQRAGDGRLPYSAFPHDKRQLSHLAIVCVTEFFPATDAEDATIDKKSFSTS